MLVQRKREGSKRAVKHTPANKVQNERYAKDVQKCKNYVLKLHRDAFYSTNVQSEQ